MIWAQATGQLQAWWLFAPSFPTEATFPLVTLHWDQGESADVRLRCAEEPNDPTFYIRLPGSQDRLFHYEMRLGLVATAADADSLKQHTAEWRDLFKDRVGRQWKSMRAYMRWRTETYRKEHPDLPPPDEVTLSFRAYKTPNPGTLSCPPGLRHLSNPWPAGCRPWTAATTACHLNTTIPCNTISRGWLRRSDRAWIRRAASARTPHCPGL